MSFSLVVVRLVSSLFAACRRYRSLTGSQAKWLRRLQKYRRLVSVNNRRSKTVGHAAKGKPVPNAYY